MSKVVFGLPKNTAAALSYVLGPISGVVFYLLEKDPFVRFHAMQSVVVFGSLWILTMLLPFTIILVFLIPLVWVVGFILWLLLIYKAWSGEKWEAPFFGKFSKKFLKQM